MTETAAGESLFFGAEEKDGPGVFLFVDMGNVFDVYKKGAMSLQEKWCREPFFQAIHGDRKDECACRCVYERFLLLAFYEEDILEGDVVDAFWGSDTAVSWKGIHIRLLFAVDDDIHHV